MVIDKFTWRKVAISRFKLFEMCAMVYLSTVKHKNVYELHTSKSNKKKHRTILNWAAFKNEFRVYTQITY